MRVIVALILVTGLAGCDGMDFQSPALCALDSNVDVWGCPVSPDRTQLVADAQLNRGLAAMTTRPQTPN